MATAYATAPDDAAALPGDVRLMQATASVLYALAGVALALLLLNWVARAPYFSLLAIQVEGDVTRNSASTIRANAAPKLAGNFFTADLLRSKQAFESVPWVRQAVVRRVWPNRLTVQLEEHRPVAVWGTGDSATDQLVNSHGEVFQANLGDVEDDSLPALSGPAGSAPRMLIMLQQLQPVFDRMGAQVQSLVLSGRGSWRVTLDNAAEVELGRGTDEEVLSRAGRFVATLAQVTGRYQRALEYADLRHHDGYAVRLKGVTTVDPKKDARN
jgi:cell division protein FtsQ